MTITDSKASVDKLCNYSSNARGAATTQSSAFAVVSPTHVDAFTLLQSTPATLVGRATPVPRTEVNTGQRRSAKASPTKT